MNKKLTLRDKAILSVLILAAFVYAGYNYLYIPATRDLGGLHEQIEELSGKDFTHLDGKLETLEAENTDGLKVIGEIKTAETDNSFDSQMFLIFLSSVCDKNGINLVKFNELGQNEQEGIWKQRYDFELCGSVGSINQVVGSIDGLKVKYSINSMSFRQNNNYTFLERLFDGISKLEWYTDPIPEPEETEEVEEPTGVEELPELQKLIPPPPAAPTITPIPPSPAAPATTPEITPTPEAEKLPEPEQRKDDSETNLPLAALSSFNFAPRVMFVTEYESSDVFRLCITIEFTMYSDPKTGGAIKSEIL